jgi:HK97 family phage portal protein
MALFDFFKKKNIETKNTHSMMGYFGVGATRQRNFTYQELATEGYMKNAIVFRCVNEISKGASSVPFVVQNVDHEILEIHPAVDLLKRPNPLQSYSEFMNAMFGFLLLSGNAYILRVQGSSGLPRELYLLRPDRIKINSGQLMR